MLLPVGEDKCRLFARALLEGAVFPAMKSIKLAFSPSLITNKAAQRRCVIIVGALHHATPPVDSKAKLIERLRAQPGYLSDAIGMWAQKGGEKDAAAVWKGIVTSVCK